MGFAQTIISHDLRSPFSSLIGIGDSLKQKIREKNIGEIEEIANLMYESISKGYKLLENLLKWAMLQTGHIKFNPEKIELSELIKNTANLLEANISQKQFKLKINIESNLQIKADALMLETVIRNLFSNAIKYTRTNGFIEIAAYQTEKETEISVTDNGVGISKENIDKLFKIENKYSTTGTNGERGTGLGLILCKEFVEKHNEKIWVESKENKGTTFIFTISKNVKL